MATTSELLRPFAAAIHAKARALKDLELTPTQRARLLEAISDDIKKCTNFVTPHASRAALDKAACLHIDLFSRGWHDQPRFDPGRESFHLEHNPPVSAIRQSCLLESEETAIFEILAHRLRVTWILKSEDAELTRLGFRSKRHDPDAAYKAARIEIVQLEDSGTK